MSDDAQILIRLGCSIDSTVEKSFQTIEQRAIKANANMVKASQAAADQVAKNTKKTASEAEKAAAKQEAAAVRLATKQARESDRAATAAERAAQKESRAAERAAQQRSRAAQRAATDAERAYDREARAAENAARREENASRRVVDRFATRTARTAVRSLLPYAPLATTARRTTAEIARGLGVTFDLASSLQRSNERESLATAISNSGFQEGAEGPAGKRVDPNIIRARAAEIGKDLGLDPTQVLEGIQAFVKKTGDLDEALRVAPQMAKLAIASNANLAEVMTGAGALATNLKGVDDKAAALDAVMRNLIAQGKLGSVEMEDFATQLPKIAAQANRFEGGSAHNVRELAALSQLSIASGGAANAAQATTSVARLVDTLSTPARAKAFHELGIKTETTNEKGMRVLRDPVEVIKDALRKTKGDPEALKKLFSSSIGSRPAEALASSFREVGGGQAGIRAVEEMLAKFAGGSLSDKNVNESVDAFKSTTAARAQQFQDRLDELTDGLKAELVPALERAEPAIIKFAETAGNVATWMLENPKEAIGAAIFASITRGGIEAAFRAGIEAIITAIAARIGIVTVAGGAGGAGAAGATAAGIAGAGLIAAGSVVGAGYEAYQLTREISGGGRKGGGWQGVKDTFSTLWNGPSKATTPEEYERLYGKPKAPEHAALEPLRESGSRVLQSLVPGADTSSAARQTAQQQQQTLQEQQQLLEQVRELNAHMKSGTLHVKVENFPPQQPATAPEPGGGRISQQ